MSINNIGPAIEAKDLSFSFGSQEVLKNLSFTVERGNYLGIIGPNGGGKTTLIRLLLGLLRPTSGVVNVFGENAALSRRHQHIGYVPQHAARTEKAFPATVEEIVRSGRFGRIGVLRRFHAKDTQAVVQEALTLTGSEKLRQRRIGDISGGERQKVFIARALAGEPDILILDEPVAGVDVSSQDEFFAFLKHLNNERRITILLVSHDVETTTQEVSSILCVNQTLICHTSPREFFQQNIFERLYGKGGEPRFLGHDHTH